jgi:hypothetical protein
VQVRRRTTCRRRIHSEGAQLPPAYCYPFGRIGGASTPPPALPCAYCFRRRFRARSGSVRVRALSTRRPSTCSRAGSRGASGGRVLGRFRRLSATRAALLPVRSYLLPATCYLLPATCYLLPVRARRFRRRLVLPVAVRGGACRICYPFGRFARGFVPGGFRRLLPVDRLPIRRLV